MKRLISILALVIVIPLLDGCNNAPKDLSGQTLAPVPVDQVKIYQKKPSSYDIVGTVTLPITPDLTWDNHAQADKAFDLLKAKAAEKGANGLLLELNPGECDIVANAGYHGDFYDVPIRLSPQRTAIAGAILVKP